MTASTCMDCKGPCTPKGDPKSHGICDHCMAIRYPAWPSSQRHDEAMRRGAAAFNRGPAAQLARIDDAIVAILAVRP